MKPGDLVAIKNPCWVREDPVVSSGNLVHYAPGSVTLVILQEDDPDLYHHKVLTPDGRIGWIFKDNVEAIQ